MLLLKLGLNFLLTKINNLELPTMKTN